MSTNISIFSLSLAVILLLLGNGVFLSIASVIETENYIIWTIPDGASDSQVTETEGGLAMIGGGADCYPAFSWLIDHANGGDFVVLRVGGTDAYNQFVYDLSVTLNKTLNSVTTISWKNKEASSDEDVLKRLRDAEVIFFSGGDQSKYVEYWAGTEVQSIIQEKLKNNVSVGGTSAGLAIQGDYIFSARNGSVFSDDCLFEPYNMFMTFDPTFLNISYLRNTITDTHFGARDRMGRMLTFLARMTKGDALSNSSNSEAIDPKAMRAIGVDEQTALLLDLQSGIATTVGANKVYICYPSQFPEVCKENQPLTFTDINCHRLNSDSRDEFDLKTLSGEGVNYVNSIDQGNYLTQKYGP